MPGIVENKTAIVTGAGRGIGRGIALLLAQEGAHVVVNDVGASVDGSGADTGPAQQVVEEIAKAGGRAIASTLNIAEPQSADAIVKSALAAFGRVDILVNNAGILRDKSFAKMTLDDFRLVLDVHLMGAVHCTKAVWDTMREQNYGRIVMTTSSSGLYGNFGQANYSAAKLGITALSKSIALDMQRFGVRSNCIAPFAWSRMTSSIPAETPEQQARVAKLQQMTPDKNAPLAVFLASDAASAFTGQIFATRYNEIFLMSQSRPLRSVHRGEGWTPALIAEHAAPALRASLLPLDRSQDVFGWDPI